jgi:hypothetical protein
MWMGLNTQTNPDMSALTFYQDISGPRFVSMTPDEIMNIGFSDGNAHMLARQRDECVTPLPERSVWFTWVLTTSSSFCFRYFGKYGWAPSDVAHQDTGERFVGEQFNVSVTFMLERLLGLNEPDFTFEVELTVIATWEDEKIFARCDGAGAGGVWEPNDPCKIFWKPEFVWSNLVMLDDPSARLQPQIIEDFGFTSRVGQSLAHSAIGGKSKDLKKSFGMTQHRVRGTFMSELDYHPFPYDKQELNITIQMPQSVPLRKAKFVTRSDKMPVAPGGGDLPLWTTECVSSSTSSTGLEDDGMSL